MPPSISRVDPEVQVFLSQAKEIPVFISPLAVSPIARNENVWKKEGHTQNCTKLLTNAKTGNHPGTQVAVSMVIRRRCVLDKIGSEISSE